MHEYPEMILIKKLIGEENWILNAETYVNLGFKIIHNTKTLTIEALIDIDNIVMFCNDNAKKHLLINGKAGSGKSLLLKYLRHITDPASFEYIIYVPIAQLLVAQPTISIIEILHQTCFTNEDLTAELQLQLQDILVSKRILWLVDEWDEIDEVGKNSLSVIKDLLSRSHIILASRYIENKLFSPDAIIQIPDMDRLAILDYLLKFDASESLLPYFQQLESCSIAETELIVLLSKYKSIGSLTDFTHSSLMQRTVNYIFEHAKLNLVHSQIENHDYYFHTFIQRCHLYLAFVAFDRGQKRIFTEETLLMVCDQMVVKLLCENNTRLNKKVVARYKNQFIQDICNFGIIESIHFPDSNKRCYAFQHILFQEYFAGQFVQKELLDTARFISIT